MWNTQNQIDLDFNHFHYEIWSKMTKNKMQN